MEMIFTARLFTIKFRRTLVPLLPLTWAWHLPLSLLLLLFYLVAAAVERHCKSHTPNTHKHTQTICNFQLFICILVAPQNLQQLVASFMNVVGERAREQMKNLCGFLRNAKLKLRKLGDEEELLVLSQRIERWRWTYILGLEILEKKKN